MSKYPFPVSLLLVFCFSRCLADTVILNTGDKLEGKITNESATDITIDVRVSPTISDEKIIPRNTIRQIEKTPPDEIAYQEISNLKPDPMTAQQTVIDHAVASLNSYLQKYPQSPRVADVKAALESFQNEKDHLAKGEVKYYGKWITGEEAAKRKVQIDGQTLLVAMKGQVSQGDLVAALNTFDQLEKSCSGSRAYPSAIVLARQILSALMQQVSHSQQVLKHDMAAWSQGVAILAEPAKSQTIAAQKAEQDRYSAMLDQSKANKWPLLIPRSEASLNALVTEAASEAARLAALPVDKMTASLDRVDKALQAFETKDIATVESLSKEAGALWPLNEEVAHLDAEIADFKKGQEKQAAAAALLAAKKTPAPKPAAPATPLSTPAQQVATSTAPSPDDSDKPSILAFFMTIPGGLSIVGGALVIIGIVAVAQKLKKPKDGQGQP
jgi:hypothetical protein